MNTIPYKAKEVKARIMERLEELGMSQKELAEKIGIAQPTLSQFMGGRNQRSMYLPEIAMILGVSTDWLVFGTGDKFRFMTKEAVLHHILERLTSLTKEEWSTLLTGSGRIVTTNSEGQRYVSHKNINPKIIEFKCASARDDRSSSGDNDNDI